MQLCSLENFDYILEFGPGYSTNIFLKYTNASILSIEEDLIWYKHYVNQYDNCRVRFFYQFDQWEVRENDKYSPFYSLVFIDGGNRLKALVYASNHLAPDGIVFLHDAHREEYFEGIRIYPYIYFPERHSCLLFKSLEKFNYIKKYLPYDYSCNCNYCSTDSRREYFRQFAENEHNK
jgi:hypothetical protein